MQTELQLFNPEILRPTPVNQSGLKETSAVSIPNNPQKSIEESLNALFPTHEKETKYQKARRILGEISNEVTDEQLEVFMTQVQFLLDSLLDSFEANLFEGKTLKQILKE